MQYNILIFYPGKNSYVGLWRPKTEPNWTIIPIETTQSGPTLLHALTSLLQSSNAHIDSITHIGAMTGPAHYTQLRIFIATANALAWSQQLPLFAIPPESFLPNDIAKLIPTARVNVPLEPIYPHDIA